MLAVKCTSKSKKGKLVRWTCKSTSSLAIKLQRQGFQVSSVKVGQLLKAAGFSLQANRKTIEGNQYPDRNARFEFIAKRIAAVQKSTQPAILVDTKKKEVLGNLKNAGKRIDAKRIPTKLRQMIFLQTN